MLHIVYCYVLCIPLRIYFARSTHPVSQVLPTSKEDTKVPPSLSSTMRASHYRDSPQATKAKAKSSMLCCQFEWPVVILPQPSCRKPYSASYLAETTPSQSITVKVDDSNSTGIPDERVSRDRRVGGTRGRPDFACRVRADSRRSLADRENDAVIRWPPTCTSQENGIPCEPTSEPRPQQR